MTDRRLSMIEKCASAHKVSLDDVGAGPSRFCLVTCHAWDTLGAAGAGWETALIKRIGSVVLGEGPQPRTVGNDLNDVADQLIARYGNRAAQ